MVVQRLPALAAYRLIYMSYHLEVERMMRKGAEIKRMFWESERMTSWYDYW